MPSEVNTSETRFDPFQIVGAEWLASNPTALLADEPGVGKTAQLILAADLVEANHVGVIAPASGVPNWRREIDRFSAGMWTHQVVSYDKADTLERTYDTLIVDEAHYLKTSTSERTRTIYGEDCERDQGLIASATRVWLASGTPMPNHGGELWTHLHALAPHLIPRVGHPGPIPESLWIKKYCAVQKGRYGTMRVVGTRRRDELNAILQKFQLRRLKRDVYKDMPPLRFTELAVEGRIDESLFADEVDVIREAIAEFGVDALEELAPEVTTLRRLTALAKVPAIVAWLKDWLATHPDEKIVVFAWHTQVYEALRRAFPTSVGIDGSTTDRDTPVQRFQNDPSVRVFVGQMQAAGTVITLTAAQTVLFVEDDWVPSNVSQAAQRIHRRGQTLPCTVIMAYLADSIDEIVVRTKRRKIQEITDVVEV